MSWIWAALTPHPPVLVPEVGLGRQKEAAATLDGMRRLCAELADCHAHAKPDWLLVLSPHAPYVPGALFVNKAPRVRGTLARFGAPSVRIDCETPPDLPESLEALLKTAAIPYVFGSMEDITQDHATIVPLCLLREAFPQGKLPPLVIANPSGLSPEQSVALGELLGGHAWKTRPALLASGDLSHRLKDDGPYGFDPAGPVFDQAVVAALKSGSPAPLLELSPSIRENAGECGLRPVLALLGLSGGPVRVFSHEGPFGVGYCTALRILSSNNNA